MVRNPSRPVRQILAILLASVVLGGLGLLFLRQHSHDGNALTIIDNAPPSPTLRWDNPDLAVLVSGQMHGYLEPCGCSSPQYGGLSRRFNFIKSLKNKGWPVVAVDLGDIAPASSPQARLKYTTAMKALDMMGYTAIGLGKNEFDLGLVHVEQYTVKHDSPRVLAANLGDGVLSGQGKKPWIIADRVTPRVGIFGVIGPSVTKQVSGLRDITLVDSKETINTVLTQMASDKPQLVVMLYQGTLQEARDASQRCAALRQENPDVPAVNVIVRLEEETEPSRIPRHEGDTLILAVGHKGGNVGVIGVYQDRDTTQLKLKYELVSMGPEYETPGGEENPIFGLLEQYAEEVKANGYLSKFPRSKHLVQLSYPEAKFVGSKRCAGCHEPAYQVWQNSAHAHAYKTLVDIKRPGWRHFDGECLSCHTVGFDYQTGFADPANSAKQNQKLVNVGCESCHGPGSAHVADIRNGKIHALINPFKTDPNAPKAAQVQKLNQLDHFCQKCHDIDNDVNWGKVPFHTKWVDRKIIHTTPKAAGAKPAAAN